MATIMTKRGQLDNVVTYEHICDTVADMANINPSYITLGSVCIVIKGENDDLEVYIADSRKEWKIVSYSSGESGSISSSGIHICAQDEYDSVTGIPTIQDPLSNTFYLTPGSNETNDLYNEWIWLEDDEEWEKFGSATTAISQPDWNQSDSSANDFIKNKPSIRQQANGGGILENGATSASGANSHAEGVNTIASGDLSHAEGYGTTASQTGCHAEGSGSQASQSFAHAEGGGTQASGPISHAEGDTTVASNQAAHAEGRHTTASGQASHAEGGYTTASGQNSHAEGADGTASGPNSHSEGIAAVALGIAAHAEGQGTIANAGYQHVAGQYNVAEDATRQLGRGTYIEIIGNGTDSNSRSNARTLDWNGNEEVAGDVIAYGCGGANPISLSDLKGQVDQAVSDVQVNGTSVVTDGVANVPVASSSTHGVLKIGTATGTGLYINPTSGILFTSPADVSELKAGTNTNRPVVPSHSHESTFYGLAKAAGDTTQSVSSNTVGTYTDDAKAAIKNMLGVSSGMNIVTVSGTAPTIAAQSNTQYLCGEVVSLDFTPAATGISDVIFTSGSTVAVLTLPATVKMPGWFEVEANKIYEICVTNGVYGAVMVWENA